MGDKTGISWTDATWNPTRGCRRTAPAGSKQSGCGNPGEGGCYAERMAGRFCGPGQPYEGLITLTANGPRWNGRGRLVVEHLADPLRWRKPRRIFVDSMSDLFFEAFSNEEIAAVFGVMAACPQHTFQILTKRPARMREWFAWLEDAMRDERAPDEKDNELPARFLAGYAQGELGDGSSEDEDRQFWCIHDAITAAAATWPLPNVWLGVSVENQAAADERIPELLATPAAVRFLSCEPLIGPVRLGDAWLHGRFIECPDENAGDDADPCEGCPAIPNDGRRGGDYCGAIRGPHIDWLIAGCESGPGARPCDVAWLRSLRDQCAAAGVPHFLKQATLGGGSLADFIAGSKRMPGIWQGPGSKRKGGGVIERPYLDGRQHLEFPEGRRA